MDGGERKKKVKAAEKKMGGRIWEKKRTLLQYEKERMAKAVERRMLKKERKKKEKVDLGGIILTGLLAGAYSRALSHYCQARALLSAAFLPWTGSNLIIQPGRTQDSSVTSMLMLDLVRAPAQHRTPASRNPGLKPSTRSCPGSSSYSHAPL